MSVSENKVLLRRYVEEVWEKQNPGAVKEFLASNYRRHTSPVAVPLNLDDQVQRLIGFRTAFPDIQIVVEEVFAEGDHIAFRSTMRGTHNGEFMGIAPTGKQVTVGLLDVIRVKDGNITGLRAVLAQMRKMGGVDALYALGDHVGLGAATDEVLDLLIQNRAHMLRGNWEELIFDLESHVLKTTNPELVRRAAAWAYAHLSSPYRDLLQGLPIQETVEIAPNDKLFLCHAAPNDTWPWTCQPDTPTPKLRQVYGTLDAKIIAYGHYHQHHVLALDGKLLLNVASVGLREDGLSGLTILEYSGHLSIQQLQVPYDTAEEERLKKERGAPPESPRQGLG